MHPATRISSCDDHLDVAAVPTGVRQSRLPPPLHDKARCAARQCPSRVIAIVEDGACVQRRQEPHRREARSCGSRSCRDENDIVPHRQA